MNNTMRLFGTKQLELKYLYVDFYWTAVVTASAEVEIIHPVSLPGGDGPVHSGPVGNKRTLMILVLGRRRYPRQRHPGR